MTKATGKKRPAAPRRRPPRAERRARERPGVPLLRHPARTRLYLDTADVLLLILDQEGRVAEINRRGLELLGYDEQELLGRDWFTTCIPGDVRDEVRSIFEHLMAGATEEVRRYENPVVTRDGKMRWFAWHNSVLRGDDGVALGTVSSGEDVTERHATTGLLEQLATGTAAAVGEDFLRQTARQLAEALGARHAFVGKIADPLEARMRILAVWPPDPFLESFEFSLDGSPLLQAATAKDCCLREDDARQRYPSDALLERLGAQSLLAAPLRDSTGGLLGFLGVADDRPLAEDRVAEPALRIVASRAAAELERLRGEQALFEAKELAEVTLKSIGDAVVTTDPEGWVTYLNPVAENLTGWKCDEAVGKPLREVFRIVHERSRRLVDDPVERCFRQGKATGIPEDTVLLARDGKEHAIADTAAPIRDREGNVVGSVLVFQDVTEARRLARQLAYRASHDALTGLPNRQEFERRLEEALGDAGRRPVRHALCYLDLDQFKVINDTCGHQAGDELLRQLSHVLQEAIRSHDTLARLGGDEFGLLLEACPLEKAEEIALEISRKVREIRFNWEGMTFEVGVSIGVVPVGAEAESTAELLSRADVACYVAKDLGRNRVYVAHAGDPELERRQSELNQLLNLVSGLEQGRFRLLFQPVVRVDGDQEPHGPAGERRERLRGEVLLRWRNLEGVWVPASELLPAAERYGLTAPIDRWVVAQALARFGRIHRSDPGRVAMIGINLSAASMNDPTLVRDIQRALRVSGLPPERVCFEITETAAVSNLDQALSFVRAIKQAGCLFALDDFGSGLSSFALLRSLPVDVLKIDGHFVRNMDQDAVDHSVVEATTRVARAMGIVTVAEWVERKSLLPALRELGVDYAQGYALGAPRELPEGRDERRGAREEAARANEVARRAQGAGEPSPEDGEREEEADDAEEVAGVNVLRFREEGKR
jgi:diguanylate cyclase (GGDEF)-like protein/PAS domain S-box-containing protein